MHSTSKRSSHIERRQRNAPHAVAATAGAGAATVTRRPRPPSYRCRRYTSSGSSGGGRSGGGSGEARSRAGREPVRPCGTRLKKCGHSHRSAPVVENLAKQPDLRDVFLCHAWDDRLGAAKELARSAGESRGVSVWFSEKDVGLGVPLLRAIDKGLANSRIGIVLVTPAFLRRLPNGGYRRQRAFGTPSA